MPYNPAIHNRKSIRLKSYDYSKAGAYFITICCQDRKRRFGKIENGEMILNELGKLAYNEWLKLPARFPTFELDVFQIMPNHMHGIIILINPDSNLNPNPKSDPDSNPVRAGFTPAPNNPAAPNNNPSPNDQNENFPALDDFQKENNNYRKNNDDRDDNHHERATARVAPTVAPTVGDILGAYKSMVANKCLKIFKLRNEKMGKIWQRNYYECIIWNERAYKNISAYIINNPKNWQEDTFNKKQRHINKG